jgi:ribosome-associated protein
MDGERAVMEIFVIEKGEYIELHDLIKVTGISSTGGAAKTAIAEGLVTVDGSVEKRKRCKLRAGQLVEYQGRKIQIR